MSKIDHLHARMISDTRGNPTIEVDAVLENGIVGRAAVPSGASTGKREVTELRDGDMNKFFGKGVEKAIRNVDGILSDTLASMEVSAQEAIDRKMIDLDGTKNKEKLGGNAILGVSLAVAKAAAIDQEIPLYEHFRRISGNPNATMKLPVPMLNVVNGGVHANNNLDFQEFMVIPLGASTFSEAIRMALEVLHELEALLSDYGYFGIGDEGGFSPGLQSSEKAIEIIIDAIKRARCEPGKHIAIGLDPAASQFYKSGKYTLPTERKRDMTTEEMVDLYSRLITKYPIISIEDGLAEDDWNGWKLLTEKLGNRVQLVGDDLFATHAELLRRGIADRLANSILIKINQVGTVTETLETMRIAAEAGYTTIISHRSGETADTTISDLAVGCSAGQLKAGCITRAERAAKYHRLLRIEEELKDKASYAGRWAYSWWSG